MSVWSPYGTLWAKNIIQQSIITNVSQVKTSGLGAPTIIEFPFILGQQFTVGNDFVTIKTKKPDNWVPNTDLLFKLNWTKSQDTNQENNRVKWQIDYFFTDVGYDISESTQDGTLESEQLYLDDGTTTHIAYDTGNDLIITADNIQEEKNFLYTKISAVTPSQDTLSEPVLLTINFFYYGYLKV